MDHPLHTTNPLPTGLSDAGRMEANDPAPSYELRLGKARSLCELQDEYTFYTPALLHLYANLPFDPLVEFAGDYKREVRSHRIKFDHQIFAGLALPGDADWNHALLAMSNEHWADYEKWLRGLALVDRSQDLLYRVRVSPLLILDPLAAQTKHQLAETPRVRINVLCLETNRGSYFMSEPMLSCELPRAMLLTKVYQDTAQLADAVLRGSPFPVEPPPQPLGVLELPVPVGWDNLSAERQQELLVALQEAKNHCGG